MSQNVAVEDEGSGKVQERMTDDDSARRNHVALDRSSGDCNHVLPDEVVLGLVDLSWSVIVRLFNPDYLKRVDVNVEWMSHLGGPVFKYPVL